MSKDKAYEIMCCTGSSMTFFCGDPLCHIFLEFWLVKSIMDMSVVLKSFSFGTKGKCSVNFK